MKEIFPPPTKELQCVNHCVCVCVGVYIYAMLTSNAFPVQAMNCVGGEAADTMGVFGNKDETYQQWRQHRFSHRDTKMFRSIQMYSDTWVCTFNANPFH